MGLKARDLKYFMVERSIMKGKEKSERGKEINSSKESMYKSIHKSQELIILRNKLEKWRGCKCRQIYKG